ncbi:MAG: hypothetical protein MI717_13015 [Spirochaetales bacterium]|nr:hypothetical protein [Spirochaetales bacterium]
MKHLFLMSGVLILLSSCASIINGSKQSVVFRSNPDDARIVVTQEPSGKKIASGETPLKVELPRAEKYFKGAEYRITIQKKGYQDHEYTIKPDLSGGWYIAGNLLFGYFIGWLIVDPLTGAMWKFSSEYESDLNQELGQLNPNSEGLQIATVDSLSPELLSQGEMILPSGS